MTIFGTRPQWSKIIGLPNHILVHIGQHYDYEMDGIFSKEMKIKPKYNIKETKLGLMYEECLDIIKKEDPDIILVLGDTRSTLAGALSAKFAGKILAHVESGLRSGDMKQPEEIIRVLVDRISDYRFCPNEFARLNLVSEAIIDNVYVVGDPMWDNLTKVLPIPKTRDFCRYNLLTIHRPQNTDNKEALKSIFEALEESMQWFIFPIHPRTKEAVKKFNLKIPPNVEVIEPQGYKEMISLETNASKILTDSGGVQREAYWFGKPVIILRWETEWKEIVDDGWGVLVGSDKRLILKALKEHNLHPALNKQNFIPPYGAKETIKTILLG